MSIWESETPSAFSSRIWNSRSVLEWMSGLRGSLTSSPNPRLEASTINWTLAPEDDTETIKGPPTPPPRTSFMSATAGFEDGTKDTYIPVLERNQSTSDEDDDEDSSDEETDDCGNDNETNLRECSVQTCTNREDRRQGETLWIDGEQPLRRAFLCDSHDIAMGPGNEPTLKDPPNVDDGSWHPDRPSWMSTGPLCEVDTCNGCGLSWSREKHARQRKKKKRAETQQHTLCTHHAVELAGGVEPTFFPSLRTLYRSAVGRSSEGDTTEKWTEFLDNICLSGTSTPCCRRKHPDASWCPRCESYMASPEPCRENDCPNLSTSALTGLCTSHADDYLNTKTCAFCSRVSEDKEISVSAATAGLCESCFSESGAYDIQPHLLDILHNQEETALGRFVKPVSPKEIRKGFLLDQNAFHDIARDQIHIQRELRSQQFRVRPQETSNQ